MSLPANLNFVPEMLDRNGASNPTSPFGGMTRKERRVSLVGYSPSLCRFSFSILSGGMC